jgi:two-component system sensor kinase FixL
VATPFEERDPSSILAVLDLAPAMIRDFDGRISYWTAGAEQLYGWASAEAVGRLSHELLQTIFPRPLGEIEAALLSDGHWHGALQHRACDGRAVRVASHWALQRDADGSPTAVAEVNTNIGAQAAAEAARIRLAAIVQSSNDAIIGKTLDGVVTDWNAAAEVLFGYSGPEIIGQSVTILYPPEDVAAEDPILDRIRHGERVEAFQTLRRHKNGSIIPVAVTVSPIIDAAGVIVGAATVMHDLRAWVERDRRLAEMQAELAHVDRLSELGQLVAALVHEINQPLTSINNYLAGLKRVISAGKYDLAPQAIKGMSEQVARADGIIRRFRDFVRKGVPTTQAENLAEIIDESIALTSIGPAAKGVSFATRLADRDTRVLVDRIQIQQVLFNLMRNAVEAMEGQPLRALSVTSVPKGDGMIEVSVADTGPGLHDEVLSNLFKPFVTTKANGMGVGLSICRSIVEGHGGHLTVDTDAGAGTVFRLTLLQESLGKDGTSRAVF